MDSTTIHLKISESLMTEQIFHDLTCTNLPVSVLCSETKSEDVTQAKLRSPRNAVEISVNDKIHEEKMEDGFIEQSWKTASGLAGYQLGTEDSFCKCAEDIKQETPIPFSAGKLAIKGIVIKENLTEQEPPISISAVKHEIKDVIIKQEITEDTLKKEIDDNRIIEVKQEILDIYIKGEITDDVLKEEIYDNHIIKEEIQDSKDRIKLEDKMECPQVDNSQELAKAELKAIVMKIELPEDGVQEEHIKLKEEIKPAWVDFSQELVKTEEKPVGMNGELPEDGLQEDPIKSERTDGFQSQAQELRFSKSICRTSICPSTDAITSSDEESDFDESRSLSLGEELDHKWKERNDLRSKNQQQKTKRQTNIKKSEDGEEYVLSKDDSWDSTSDKKKLHSDEKCYECNICGKKFTQKSNLHTHLYSHSEKKQFKCTKCDKYFSTPGSRSKHIRETHSEMRPQECEICGKSYKRLGSLQIHLRLHSDQLRYSCDHCERRFNQRVHYESHLLTHTRNNYKCTKCDKSFVRKSEYLLHEKSHMELPEYRCLICAESFTQPRAFYTHRKSHGVKPYLCLNAGCGKEFGRLSHLQVHEHTHSGLKPFVCKICNKTFAESSYLKTHVKAHSDEKSYECSQCNKHFKSLGNLKKHAINHSNVENVAKNFSN